MSELFDTAPYTVTPPPPRPKESPDSSRTRRQREAITWGYHPLALVVPGLRLHADASKDPADWTTGPRCGGCRFRVTGRRYPKCGLPTAVILRWTGGPATDCRAWWPACTDFEPKELP